MSRQSKNVKKKALAAKFTELRKSGGSGPKSTTPAHNKAEHKRAYTRTKRGPKDTGGAALAKKGN